MKADSYVKSDLTEYLKDSFNINLYNQLTDEPFWEGLFDPLEYFNLLYSELDFFCSNAEEYLCIKQHYGKLELNPKQKYLFLYPFKDLLNKQYFRDDFYCGEIEQMSIDFIKRLYDDIDRQIFPFRAAVSPIIMEDLYFVPTTEKPRFEPYIKVNKAILPYKTPPKHLDIKYTLPAVQDKLEQFDSIIAKIDYLVDISTEYQQLPYEGYSISKQFIEQCDLEIKKLKAQSDANLAGVHNTLITFKLSKKCSKIDLIRLLNAMWELRMINDEHGQTPSKSEFMNAAGKFFGASLSSYEVHLSQAFGGGNIETNTEIFETLKAKTESIIQEKLM